MGLEIKWKHDIGDHIVGVTKNKKASIDLTVIDRIVKTTKVKKNDRKSGFQNRNDKWYKYHCNICSNEDWISESNLVHSKAGCNVCGYNSQKVLVGYNDLNTTNPDLVKYLINKSDATKYSASSTTMVECICPECGHKKRVAIYNLHHYGFCCPNCTDGFSYPEKFMHSVLKQAGVDYISQYNKRHSEWCGQYRYDFYFRKDNIEYVIETHGMQHYQDANNWTQLEVTINNDESKKTLALKNGIAHQNYIVIDCRYSVAEYIKNSIYNSRLCEIIQLDTIDWDVCAKEAEKHIVYEVCQLWTSGYTARELSEKYKVSDVCIYRYLKRGSQLCWCDYIPTKKRLSKNA